MVPRGGDTEGASGACVTGCIHHQVLLIVVLKVVACQRVAIVIAAVVAPSIVRNDQIIELIESNRSIWYNVKYTRYDTMRCDIKSPAVGGETGPNLLVRVKEVLFIHVFGHIEVVVFRTGFVVIDR